MDEDGFEAYVFSESNMRRTKSHPTMTLSLNTSSFVGQAC